MPLNTLTASLANRGLSIVGDAVLQRGKQEVEKRLGVTLSEDMTPEQTEAVRIKALEHAEFLVEAANRDRANARAAMNKSDVNRYFLHGLAAFWSITAVALIAGIVFTEIPESSVRFADTILGFVLGTVIATILGFYYGTSAKETEQ